MSGRPYPLIFKPVYKDYIWGGQKIARHYGRKHTPRCCAESWECSTRPEGMSVVAAGPWAGRTLVDLARTEGAALLGNAVAGRGFPLLIKLIDAREKLSVQVHPDEISAASVAGEPKTEAWYVIAAEPGARLYAGLQPGVTRAMLSRAAASEDPSAMIALLRSRTVVPDDVVFVPGGRVHAIGSGILLLEVQQNSNTTFRIYDWGRKDSDGKSRPLHLEQALQVINWDEPDQAAEESEYAPELEGWFQKRIGCRWFVVEQACLTGALDCKNDGAGFHALFTVRGDLAIESGGDTTAVDAGVTVLMPAAMGHYVLRPALTDGGTVEVVRMRVPAL